MEKRTGNTDGEMIRVVLTGPECTGKSTLAVQLARHYNTICIPEYAREYVSALSRPYTYSDVEHIAATQVRQKDEFSARANKILFLDTYLIITKVWFDVVFHRCPGWIKEELSRKEIQLYLLCNTDIPWEPDPVRENGGSRREYLLELYKKELETWECPYRIVSGTGEIRLQNAILLLDKFIQKDGKLINYQK
jgi:NadR type nicotinamide-nucleotide adenylyltransferase